MIAILILGLFAFLLKAVLYISVISILFAIAAFIRSRIPALPEKPKTPSKFWRAIKAFWATLKAEL